MNDKKEKVIQLIIILIILLFATGLGVTVGTITWIFRETPDISDYGQWQTSETTTIYTADGEKLTRLFRQDRVYVELDDIPDELKQAIVAIEDSRFYSHRGIDVKGIMRAISVNIQRMARAEGASTITQQLARNTLLTPEKLFSRKFQEMFLALEFERMYTKNEVLEFYLNEIFLGHSAYGVQSAARFYFNKDVSDLTLSESALIAGLPRSPNNYSPYNNMEAAKRRRNIVLNRMVELGYISHDEAQEARSEEINLEHGQEEDKNIAPYFVEHIRRKLLNEFGAQKVYAGGLQVHTTLDLEMQKAAEETIQNAIDNGSLPSRDVEGNNFQQPQLGVLTVDPNNGHIKAMIGGRGDDKFNRTTQAHRQPGSAFKPFVYTESVRNGAGAGTVIDDTRKEYVVDIHDDERTWIPRNANDTYVGPTVARYGLARSVNVMAVRLLDQYGIRNTMLTAQEMGIDNLIEQDRNLSLALGGLTRGVTMLEMTRAYGTLASGGVRSEPASITEILDSNGNTVYSNSPQRSVVLEEAEAYIVTDMLQSAMARGDTRGDLWGTGWRAHINRPAAGKTGTSSNYNDAWFIGYTPELVTSIWIGEDSPSKMEYPVLDDDGEPIDGEITRITSGTAAELWGNYMSTALNDYPVTDFDRPNDIIEIEICNKSGGLPGDYCPEHTITEELFIDGREPTESCSVHKETDTLDIYEPEWLIASPASPEEDVTTVEYQVDTGYVVNDDGLPIRELNEDNQVPLTDDDGAYIYKEIPTEEHEVEFDEDFQEEDNIENRLWDFFNILRNNN